MEQMEMKLSLARIYYPVRVLGPGRRAGIWLNGCDRDCPGCVSPELKTYDESKEVSIGEIMRMLRCVKDPVDGFTISGGEPFRDADALNALVIALNEISDDILIFTGYTIEELKAQGSGSVDSVLENCAALIDGPYVRELNDGTGLRGSSNQRILVFRHHDRYAGAETCGRELQNVVFNNRVVTIGIPQGDK